MSSQPIAGADRGGQPSEAQLYALLAGITQAAEGRVVVPDRALMAASGRALKIWRDEGRQRIVLELADDVPTGPGLPAGYQAWEDTFVDGRPPELGG